MIEFRNTKIQIENIRSGVAKFSVYNLFFIFVGIAYSVMEVGWRFHPQIKVLVC